MNHYVRWAGVWSCLLWWGCSATSSKDPVQTLRIPSPSKIKGLDPAYANDLYSGREISYIYEGLLHYHYLKRPYVLEPNLAEAMPTVHTAKDGRTTLTFKLRKGVLFQDDPCFSKTDGKGREMVADDVVYSVKRIADPKTVSTGWWVYDGRLVGLNAWRDEAARTGVADYAKEVEGIRALDRYTVQFKLNSPSAQFLYVLTMPSGFVVPREAVERYGSDFVRNPVGTGPFVFDRKASNLGTRLIYTKNPTFRDVRYPTEGEAADAKAGLLKDAGAKLPMLDKVITEVLPEKQPLWLQFLSGALDLVEIPKDNFEQAIGPNKELVQEYQAKGYRLHKSVDMEVVHISFNLTDPLLGKLKEVRQAMSMAFNREKFIELFYNGRAVKSEGPIPPGLNGYDPKFKNPMSEYNLPRAKELLAKAGYPGGSGLPVFEHVVQNSTDDRQMADYFASSMAQIGIRIKSQAYTWPEFIASVNHRKNQIFGWAWIADYPDAENFLQMFYSKNAPPGPNDSSYNNAEYDRLYEESLKLTDSPARTALYKKMVALVTDDAPWIFTAHRVRFELTQSRVLNYKHHAFEHARPLYLKIEVPTESKRP
jgi:oligopeptide transport system substrate-binding protein